MYKYLVTALRTPEFQQSVIPEHNEFLDQLRQLGKLELSGPFTDKSGGAYVIRAIDLADARAVAFSDPLHTTHSSTLTVYEWQAK